MVTIELRLDYFIGSMNEAETVSTALAGMPTILLRQMWFGYINLRATENDHLAS